MPVEQFEIRPSKIAGYLLAIDHPDGGSKAKFLLGRGSRLDNAQVLADALAHHAIQNWPGTGTLIAAPYGMKHRIVGPLTCPDGSRPDILVIWKVETGSTTATLVTAYPN